MENPQKKKVQKSEKLRKFTTGAQSEKESKRDFKCSIQLKTNCKGKKSWRKMQRPIKKGKIRVF